MTTRLSTSTTTPSPSSLQTSQGQKQAAPELTSGKIENESKVTAEAIQNALEKIQDALEQIVSAPPRDPLQPPTSEGSVPPPKDPVREPFLGSNSSDTISLG